jgi:riboflavin synthase
MFTGIVHKGKVVGLKKTKDGIQIQIQSERKLPKLENGESIAIDGACLSMIKQKGDTVSFFVSPETLDKTIIGKYKKGTTVNLELPLRNHDFLGGHYVLGHVDTVSQVKNIKELDEVWFIEIELPKQFTQYVVYKGSIAVNGVSLTVNKLKKSSFDLCIIPVTLEKSNLTNLVKGSSVNLEFDILAKYTERILKKRK